MSFDTSHDPQKPLYAVIGEIVAVWTLANIGYYLVLPRFGLSLSYNTSPFVIAGYFLIWAVITIVCFWSVYSKWLVRDSRIWLYGLLSLGAVGVLWLAVYGFSLLPTLLHTQLTTPYTDILLATPWYFLPKAVDILVQQLLITVLVLELFFRFESLKKVVIGYALCFGSAHILLFLMNGAPTPYALIMTFGAFFSSLIFPYLMLRVRGGFVYAFMIHFIFYLLLAVMLHIMPPPGYVV